MQMDYLLALNHRVLSRKEEYEHAKKSRQGDARSTEFLIVHNQRRVFCIARRFSWKGDISDRMQDGNIGLLRAIERFEPKRGYRLGTLADFCIRSEIYAGLDNEGAIRLPREQRHLMRRILQAIEEYVHLNGSRPSHEEIAGAISSNGQSYSPERVKELISYYDSLRVGSLNKAFGEDATELGDLIEGNAQCPHSTSQNRDVSEVLRSCLEKMPSREAQALTMAFLDGRSNEEIAYLTMSNPATINQIKSKALRRIGAMMRKMGISPASLGYLD